MKITLLHPSRGRARQAREVLDFWMKRSSGIHQIEHIISIDMDDPQREAYINNFTKGSHLVVSDNKNVVEATNVAAKKAEGDIFIYLSDDFQCPQNWDAQIVGKIRERGDKFFFDPWLLKVDDCLQKFGVDVLTIPIMSKALYVKLGYFWHPLYKSMFVDQDLYHTCLNLGCMVTAEELKFPHMHYSVGKSANDDTYKRSSSHWNSGKRLYQERKSLNFPLR